MKLRSVVIVCAALGLLLVLQLPLAPKCPIARSSAFHDWSKDWIWEDTITGSCGGADPEFDSSKKFTRKPVRVFGIPIGAAFEVTYTVADSSLLKGLRLAYVVAGIEFTAGEVSHVGGSVGASSASATVSGFVPLAADRVRLLHTVSVKNRAGEYVLVEFGVP